MISKLPRWVEFGACFLAFLAGWVNAVGLLGFQHQAVSHLTGTSTFLGLAIAHLNFASCWHLILVVASFLLGAAISGAITGSVYLALGRRYGLVLLLEALCLVVSAYLLAQGNESGQFFASAACGLQNAMATVYSGSSIRTTHVSGLFTDLGIMLGVRLRGHLIDTRKMTLYLLLIVGFVAGGVLGALSYYAMQFMALLFPAGMALTLALLYEAFRHRL